MKEGYEENEGRQEQRCCEVVTSKTFENYTQYLNDAVMHEIQIAWGVHDIGNKNLSKSIQ